MFRKELCDKKNVKGLGGYQVLEHTFSHQLSSIKYPKLFLVLRISGTWNKYRKTRLPILVLVCSAIYLLLTYKIVFVEPHQKGTANSGVAREGSEGPDHPRNI